jgi:hypothetical protein
MKEFGLIPSRKYSFVRFINIITYLTRSVLLRFTHPDSALPYTVMLGPVHPHSTWRGVTNHEPFSTPPCSILPQKPRYFPPALCIRLSPASTPFKISRRQNAKKFSRAIRLFKSADISETYCLRHSGQSEKIPLHSQPLLFT